MSDRTLEFWFDFASPYAYLSAQRIEALAAADNVRVVYRPMLLGPVFQAIHGVAETPFARNPARMNWMRVDVPRQAKKYGVPFAWPPVFPKPSLLGTRVALLGEDAPWVGAFVRGLFRASFVEGADIASEAIVRRVLGPLVPDADELLRATQLQTTKDALRARGTEALERGIFGAPTFFANDAFFWGDDRLDDALAALR